MDFFFVFIENVSNIFSDQLQNIILPYIFPWIDFGIRKFIWLQEKFENISFFPNKSNIYKNILKNNTWYYTGFLLHSNTYTMIHNYDKEKMVVSCEMDNKIETLYIQRQENICICSIDTEKTFDTEPSKVRFLYIEYFHKGNTISLDIPDEMMYVGNEIFSPAFVYRLLDHSSRSFLFDFAYHLVLVDEQLKSTTLDSGKYVVLEKNSYLIQSMD